MAEKRFKLMLRFCRFDCHNIRAIRLQSNKLAVFRDIRTMFNANMKRVYRTGKPGKYGIKTFPCCDAETSHQLSGELIPQQTTWSNGTFIIHRKVVDM
ncbi:hypothetical protein T11_7363 [Trichinella zimbabwensis]|uniref:PiggyBac transposable element-derived protein domain-containing protein n=1 Tax=Trichinella zimbabwensis TaxID=268475 RepID=A0A0V1HB24_9BILA|nr:hypothetical protein T11_7363 [Trichinella zimbabwensis]